MFAPEEALAVAVLHHSIRRRASLTVETVAVSEGSDAVIDAGDRADGPSCPGPGRLRSLWAHPVEERELILRMP